MKQIKKILPLTILVSILTGCAASQGKFTSDQYTLSDTKVCRNYIKDKDKLGSGYTASDDSDSQYVRALKGQVRFRNLTVPKCESLISSQNSNIFAGVAAVTVAALVVNAAKNSGGGSYQSGYAWDAFYDNSYRLVWRCRNKSNGQFAYDSSCSGKLKTDNTWPAK
jgi:hypothetical protein